jgi:hypothetical protein
MIALGRAFNLQGICSGLKQMQAPWCLSGSLQLPEHLTSDGEICKGYSHGILHCGAYLRDRVGASASNFLLFTLTPKVSGKAEASSASSSINLFFTSLAAACEACASLSLALGRQKNHTSLHTGKPLLTTPFEEVQKHSQSDENVRSARE